MVTLRKDTVTRDYISDATVFADAFNYFIYGGKQVIRPEQQSNVENPDISMKARADRLMSGFFMSGKLRRMHLIEIMQEFSKKGVSYS